MENENKISSMAGSAHCTEEIMSACALCPRECLADRGAGKKGFCAWMREFIWQGLHFTCGRNPVSPEQKVPGQCSFPGADCAAVSARIMILPSGAGDGL